MTLQWWCSATGEPWTWAWQAYPGVWLVVAVVGWAGWQILGMEATSTDLARQWRRSAWIGGTLILWGALDWPIGPLGASYLASIHMVQYLMVGLVAPALFLLAVPPQGWRALHTRPRMTAVLNDLTQPVIASIVFNAGMTFTHWPAVVDGLRVSQLGSFVLDALWLGCGLVFWWPVIAPRTDGRRVHPIFLVGYLFVNGVLLTPPAVMLLFSQSPIYAVYELAPPIRDTPVIWDQQLAGAFMKVGSAVIAAVAGTIVFLLWMRQESGVGARQT